MRFNIPRLLGFSTAALSLSLALVSSAFADDDERAVTTTSNATWQAECSACHIAYPPRLLPRESWRAMMSNLKDHFGSDASLAAPATQEIATFLEENAGRKRQSASGKPIMRISETRWFQHEHDEVSSAVWKSPKVKSPANCAACHTQAERGNYSERYITIPK